MSPTGPASCDLSVAVSQEAEDGISVRSASFGRAVGTLQPHLLARTQCPHEAAVGNVSLLSLRVHITGFCNTAGTRLGICPGLGPLGVCGPHQEASILGVLTQDISCSSFSGLQDVEIYPPPGSPGAAT